MTSNRHNGFTLIELLIALALVTVLLASLGFGMKAGMQTYNENDKLAQVTQTARVVLNRMTSEIRTARFVQTTDTSITIYPATTVEDVAKIVYSYEDGALFYNQYSTEDSITYLLLNNVVVLTEDDELVCIKNFGVKSESDFDYNGRYVVSNVMVTILIRCGDREFPYTISVAPRRAQLQ